MGLLSEGTVVSWEESMKLAGHLRYRGIKQFVTQYSKSKTRSDDVLLWGDEIESQLIRFDHTNKKVFLILKGNEFLETLKSKDTAALWHPEFAGFTIESTPGKPYSDFKVVESNMKLRRQLLKSALLEDEFPLTIPVFPRLFTENIHGLCNQRTTTRADMSLQGPPRFHEAVISKSNVKYQVAAHHISKRRSAEPPINIPVYLDKCTERPFREGREKTADGEDGRSPSAKVDHIYMEGVGHAASCCCLQVTLQARDVEEARHLYDQLAVLCPIMLALTASSPIHKGFLSEVDTRWPVMTAGLDDRTDEERVVKPLRHDEFRIVKSRYDSIDSYISPMGQAYNDLELTFDSSLREQIMAGGVSEPVAQHIAHLFIRDRLVVLAETLSQDDDNHTDHFEEIQSTNWRSMRFKLPPPGSDIGWRVEFRTMEVQLTDFENAAFAAFIILVTRITLAYRLNLLIPISKVDENFKVSSRPNAVLHEKFHFRKNITTELRPLNKTYSVHNGKNNHGVATVNNHPPVSNGIEQTSVATGHENECCEKTINEIFHGTAEHPGLLPLMYHYIDTETDPDTRSILKRYLDFISKRASGECPTRARWMREFVLGHQDYQQDSSVSDSIAYDMLWRMTQISSGHARDSNDVPF